MLNFEWPCGTISNRGYRPSKSLKKEPTSWRARMRRRRGAARRSAISPSCHRCALHVSASTFTMLSFSILCGLLNHEFPLFVVSVLSSSLVYCCVLDVRYTRHGSTSQTLIDIAYTFITRSHVIPERIGIGNPDQTTSPQSTRYKTISPEHVKRVFVWLYLHVVLASIRLKTIHTSSQRLYFKGWLTQWYV